METTDTPRHDATGRDTDYTLSVDDALALYERSGHPRTPRTIQRYCAAGHLDCLRVATQTGDRYFIDPASVTRHIAQIEEMIQLEQRAAGRGLSRHDATPVAVARSSFQAATTTDTVRHVSEPVAAVATPIGEVVGVVPQRDEPRQDATPPAALSRPVATDEPNVSHYVARVEQLEREVERANEDRDFLKDQIKTKDQQIGALLERDRETNVLVRTLQQMLSPLLGGGNNPPSDSNAMQR